MLLLTMRFYQNGKSTLLENLGSSVLSLITLQTSDYLTTSSHLSDVSNVRQCLVEIILENVTWDLHL